jgi:TRAP-type C4-dicarboxylate transport system substrate-binding protein
MEKIKMVVTICLAFAISAFLTLAPNAQAKTIELRLTHQLPANTFFGKHIQRWADKVFEDSNGQLKIRIYPSSTLGLIPPEFYDGVVKGSADLYYGWRYKPKKYDVGVVLPSWFSCGSATAIKVYEELWKEFPDIMTEEWKDVKILWIEPSAPNYLISRKPLNTLADIKGQQIRVPSKEQAANVKGWGASPAFMSIGDFVVGLDKGTVDGAISVLTVIIDFKLEKKLTNAVLVSVGTSVPCAVAMNKDAFNKLPANLQDVVEKSALWGKEEGYKMWMEWNDRDIKFCNENNIKLITPSPEETAKMNAVMESARKKTAADLDKKGFPGTKILQFITERIAYYDSK